MDTFLFLSLFSVLGIIYFCIGLYSSKNIENTSDYFLAGRALGLISVTFTLVATQLGGGMLLGTSEQAYKIGIYGILYTLGMAIGFIILGLGLAPKLQSLNISTTAELFQTHYGSTTLKKIASLLSVITMGGLLVGQVVGSKILLLSLGISNDLIFIVFWIFIVVYTMVGGLKAVVFTDVAQIIYITIVFTGIFLYCLWQEPSSFFSLSSLLDTQKNFRFAGISGMSFVATVMIPALFSLIEQDLAQRFFAARTKKIAAASAIGASFFLLLFALIPIYLGMKARTLHLAVAPGASPLVPVIGALTNEFVVILAVCGIIAAITSTADSLLCAISSNVTQDFDFSFIHIKSSLTLSKIVTLAIGILALGASYIVAQDVITILVGSYEISVCCLLIPLLFAYFNKNLKSSAAWGAVLAGLTGYILFRIIPIPIPKEIAALILSLLGYLIGNSLT